MALRVKVTPIERQIKVLMDRTMSPAAQSAKLASTAREALREAQQINARALGTVPEHETYVDGRLGASEDTVKPDGRIVYEFNTSFRAEILAWILTQLREKAPVRRGRYRDSIKIFADFVEVATAEQAVEADEVVFVSTVAYARKIEGGPNRAPQSPQAPNGVFHAVAALATAKWSKTARIRFTFAVPLSPGSHLEQWASGRDAVRRRQKTGSNSTRQAAKDRRNPAVSVRFR